jgi:anaerobic selenocysteine-containing dehydrogenase
MKSQRRTFIIHSAAASAASLLGAQAAFAQKLELVKDTDANAVALGYKTDGTKTDTKKYPKYAKEQVCSNCALWVGDVKAPEGKCALFAGKAVANKAWCSAWAKKA